MIHRQARYISAGEEEMKTETNQDDH